MALGLLQWGVVSCGDRRVHSCLMLIRNWCARIVEALHPPPQLLLSEALRQGRALYHRKAIGIYSAVTKQLHVMSSCGKPFSSR